ncbi:MAG: cytochrome P450 [Alphaproteobacteria bacterium]|nr:cytochrome P450 [Alphaproteobacteria bacterium]
MRDLVPPFPDRPKHPLSAFATLRAAQRNFLEIWEERCFEWEIFSHRLLSRTLLVCNSPDTVASAFVEHHDSFERKSPQMRHGLAPLLGDGLFISDGDTWRRRRRIVAPIVHVSHLPLFVPLIVQAASETAERWARSGPDQPINVLTEMATLTAEIICRTVFGRQLGAEHAAEIVAAFTRYQQLIGQLDVVYFLGLPDWIPRIHAPAIHRSAKRIHKVLDQVIRDCRERLSGGEASMIRLLLEARDPESGETLDDAALRNEAAVIFMAGHETTANSLAWTWYLLSQAPDVEERLHIELAQVLDARPPTLDDVPKLTYTRAVFEETVRLYPPVPLLARQALRDEAIRGRPVSSGSLVMVVPWLLHRHRRFWGKPDHYIPERFLPENARFRVRHAYIPFSVGPRICAGAAFGLTEAILCIATLAQRARLRLAPGASAAPVCRLTLRPGDDLWMLVQPRG